MGAQCQKSRKEMWTVQPEEKKGTDTEGQSERIGCGDIKSEDIAKGTM